MNNDIIIVWIGSLLTVLTLSSFVCCRAEKIKADPADWQRSICFHVSIMD